MQDHADSRRRGRQTALNQAETEPTQIRKTSTAFRKQAGFSVTSGNSLPKRKALSQSESRICGAELTASQETDSALTSFRAYLKNSQNFDFSPQNPHVPLSHPFQNPTKKSKRGFECSKPRFCCEFLFYRQAAARGINADAACAVAEDKVFAGNVVMIRVERSARAAETD